MSELSQMPVVTVEQIVRFREAAIQVEKQRDELRALNAELVAAIKDDIANRTAMPKSCGHEFFCICSSDRVRAAIEKSESKAVRS